MQPNIYPPPPIYSRIVKTAEWYNRRQGEPIDYQISEGETRDLTQSTVRHFGLFNSPTPESTYQHMTQDVFKKHLYQEKHYRPMINLESFDRPTFDRSMGWAERGAGALLPRFPKDFDQLHMQTTHKADFEIPYACCKQPKLIPKIPPNNLKDHRRKKPIFGKWRDI